LEAPALKKVLSSQIALGLWSLQFQAWREKKSEWKTSSEMEGLFPPLLYSSSINRCQNVLISPLFRNERRGGKTKAQTLSRLVLLNIEFLLYKKNHKHNILALLGKANKAC
jgi:hypothetical protein